MTKNDPRKTGEHDSYIPEPPKTRKYTIEVTEKQLGVLIEATEILARIGIGQFWTILEHISGGAFDDAKLDYDLRRFFEREAYALFKPELNLPRGAGPGIHSKQIHERHLLAWEMHQVFRHRDSWDRHPEGGSGVNFFPPYQDSSEPLAKIEKKK